MAKYCMRRLAAICRKGPRGKVPSLSEIETASVRVGYNLVILNHIVHSIVRMLLSTLRHLANLLMP